MQIFKIQDEDGIVINDTQIALLLIDAAQSLLVDIKEFAISRRKSDAAKIWDKHGQIHDLTTLLGG